MSKSQSSIPAEELAELQRVYTPLIEGKEKIWTITNVGEDFELDKEKQKFSVALGSEGMKHVEQKLAKIHGA